MRKKSVQPPAEPLVEPPLDLPDGSVRALVVDPHPLTRIGLGVLLNRQGWVERCLLASNREEGLALIERHRPDVAVVDVSDVGPFIASYLAPLRASRPSMPVVLGAHCTKPSHAQLLAAGEAGLLTPDLSIEQVLGAVRAAIVEQEFSLQTETESSDSDQLSEREREVLVLLSTGATNREIAAAMHLGTEMVKKHAGTLYRKLGVRNRTEAAQRAATLLAA
jgi:DNA-binding NarL/FixJ family response regulator